MKENCLVLKDKNGKKTEYRILINVKETSTDLNYVIYTDDKKDKNGSIIAYASSYVLSDKGNMTKFKSLTKEEMVFLNKILSSLDNN